MKSIILKLIKSIILKLIANAYQYSFTWLFKVIENLIKIPVKFLHINGAGWKCILGDFNVEQAKGLDLGLIKRDPGKHIWLIFLNHIWFIF